MAKRISDCSGGQRRSSSDCRRRSGDRVLVDLHEWRCRQEGLDVFREATDADEPLVRVAGQIGTAIPGDPVADRVLADTGPESPRMVTEQPVRHVAATGQSHHPDALRVGEPALDRPVHEMEMVGAVDLAPTTVDGLGERLAVAARSTRVRIEDVESRVGEREHLQPGCRSVRGVRTAMNLDDDRTGSRRIPSLDQPGIDGMSFRVRQPVTNRIAAVRLEPVRAIASIAGAWRRFRPRRPRSPVRNRWRPSRGDPPPTAIELQTISPATSGAASPEPTSNRYGIVRPSSPT